MLKVIEIQTVSPHLGGYGDATATYIYWAGILSVCTLSISTVHESECGSTMVIHFPTKKGTSI